jgi:hypothetical protein
MKRIIWLEKGEEHRTYQPSRWWAPEWKFRIYWSGSIAKPNEHIRLFFHRLELYITTPKFIKAIMKRRRLHQEFKMNLEYDCCCPQCGSYKVTTVRGFAYEPIAYCTKCGYMEEPDDIEPYIV